MAEATAKLSRFGVRHTLAVLRLLDLERCLHPFPVAIDHTPLVECRRPLLASDSTPLADGSTRPRLGICLSQATLMGFAPFAVLFLPAGHRRPPRPRTPHMPFGPMSASMVSSRSRSPNSKLLCKRPATGHRRGYWVFPRRQASPPAVVPPGLILPWDSPLPGMRTRSFAQQCRHSLGIAHRPPGLFLQPFA